MEIPDEIPADQIDPIIEQVGQSAASIDGTLTSVKFTINEGVICISTDYTMNGNYILDESTEPEAEALVDEIDPEPVYVSSRIQMVV